MLDIDIKVNRTGFHLSAAFRTNAGITAIFGPSGSGKTTLINCVAGLVQPDQGVIRLGDRTFYDRTKSINSAVPKRRVGYIFQNPRLFPHLSVERNLMYSVTSRRDMFDQVVDLLDLLDLLQRWPRHLSGGEQQRVAIGRALLSDPQILLMDEPLSALDRTRRDGILNYLEKLRDQTDMPILYVSHDLDEVARLANQIVVLDKGQMIAAGDSERLLSDPSLLPHFGLHQGGSVISARIRAHHSEGLTELDSEAGRLFLPRIIGEIDEMHRVQIRASDVILSTQPIDQITALNQLTGQIETIHLGGGPGAAVILRKGDTRLMARVTQKSLQHLRLKVGQTCHAIFKATAIKSAGRAPRQ
ncbi:molybdenum ABC transporter ATP-binding protein [Pseudaestuariivita rosea]|uniref:molybdenum ABC transporter ATP-binding protein n=1 Tax=Pseudaestuariivita rosea TaxID=2763263 RepID=UPI001ABB832A|nr:molybdenum ABC transporter ATP-binding protein [Pseudaestuariivita rosea]